jgi:hypothetical protein
MKTTAARKTVEFLVDGRYYHVTGDVTPGTRGRLHAAPEDCYPAESGEVVVVAVETEVDGTWVTLDIDTALDIIGEDEIDDAFCLGYVDADDPRDEEREDDERARAADVDEGDEVEMW